MNHVATLDALAAFFRIRLDVNRANSCAAARDRLAAALREIEDLERQNARLEALAASLADRVERQAELLARKAEGAT